MPARFPTETNWENPIRSAIPYARIPAQSAPLCETKAMFPRGGRFSLKVALRLTAGLVLRRPKQFGPTSDMRYFAAVRMSSSSSGIPAPPTSRNPDEITITPRVPARPSSSTTPATCGAGTMTIPRSGVSGSEAMFG